MAISRIKTNSITDSSVTSIKLADGVIVAADLANGSVTPPKIQTGVDFAFNGLTIGRGAGNVATNTAVGASALAANITGSGVTAVGQAALLVSTGNNNTALGKSSLTANTSGVDNSAGGKDSLGGNTTGSYNTAFGSNALVSNTTASNNTAVGYQAGYSNTSGGASHTFVGYRAGYSTTGGTNSAFGTDALYSNTTGDDNTAVGSYRPLYSNTTGSQNIAVGRNALYSNTTGGDNTAVGYRAGYSNSTATGITAIGKDAGFAATGNYNTMVGWRAGEAVTSGTDNTIIGGLVGLSSTGSQNIFIGGPISGVGNGTASLMTTGSKNTIIGRFNGNQGSLDIRTANNYIVLSDGDGNPRIYNTGGTTTLSHNLAVGTGIILQWSGDFFAYPCDAGSFNAAVAGIKIQKITSTNRSLNAAGTINASGTDYAEYMTKASLDFTVAKGDVVGINADGKLTNVFADAIAFVVKSTDPSYVGGDSWGAKSQDKDGPQYTEEELEEQRQWVDRIAFSGQVPVNVIGATAGQYIVPVNDGGAIKGEAVFSPTFEQYQSAVGKVIAIEQDGRARIIVKVA